MMVAGTYLLAAVAALAAFRLLTVRQAVLAVFLGGWLILPVGSYPPGSANAVFPYWIVGLALPSDMLLNKAWVVPATVILGVLVFDRPTLRAWRPGWVDLPVVLWFLWPLCQGVFIDSPSPPPWLATVYLAGTWGLPWLLGRLYFSTVDEQRQLIRCLAWAGLACLPIAIVEGMFGPQFYGWLYEAHPFRDDGAVRGIGFRPLGFFENGNQYGIWICVAALAALWVASADRATRRCQTSILVAATVIAMALASQSAGAIVLLGAASAMMASARWALSRAVIVAMVVLPGLVGAVYLSGAVPVARIANDTVAGRAVVAALKEVGGRSFTWRISQDQKLLTDATRQPLLGQGRWDWWREKQTRPWGLAMLTLGQFGGTGMGLAFAVLLAPAFGALWRRPTASPWAGPSVAVPLALVVLMSAIDALLNSFLYFPALLAAGAIAASHCRGGPVTAAS